MKHLKRKSIFNKPKPSKLWCNKWSKCLKNNAKKNHNSCKFVSHTLTNLSTLTLNIMKINSMKHSKLTILPSLKWKINMKIKLLILRKKWIFSKEKNKPNGKTFTCLPKITEFYEDKRENSSEQSKNKTKKLKF